MTGHISPQIVLRRITTIGASSLAGLLALAAASQDFAPDDAEHQRTIVPFLTQHCEKCHGPDAQKADFRVDRQLPNDFFTRSVAERWTEVLNKLHKAEMPPKDEPPPQAADVTKVIDWITRERLRGEKARKATTVVLRRLNRAEYNNTIMDLTGIDIQPAEFFPADPASGGFDNNGAALTISPLQLELYVKAAQQVLDRAIVTEKERPPGIKWRFQIEEGFQAPLSSGGVLYDHPVQIDGRRMSVNPGCNSHRDGMTVLRRPRWDSCGNGRFGGFEVPRPGYYMVRMRAAGVTPSNEEVLPAAMAGRERWQEQQEKLITDPEQRRRNRAWFEEVGRDEARKHFISRHYHYGPPRAKLTHHAPGVERILGEFDVTAPESEPGIYEVRAWFEPGSGQVVFHNVYNIARYHANFYQQGKQEFPRPELLVDWMELEGPLYDAWPPSSHRRIFIDSPHKDKDEDAYAREVLARFMKRAYRRPLGEGEVDAKLALFRKVRPDRSSFEEAIKMPLIAVLSSPHFLYLAEESDQPVKNKGRALNDFELASRLSYFLWSSMPDENLMLLAEKEKLDHPQTLIAQANRLLASPRSEQFVKNFAGQWLKLRDIGSNPPAQMLFLEYDDHLETSMRGETEAFFAHILAKDLSVMNFIHSDFITINERLARFYDIRGVKGDHFREVKIPQGVSRGGLVTQAAILAVTSNGTRTSPVWRGVWILERLLGDPPPPPPPNAGDIPPGVPGIDKATVRDRLRIHREQPQCARCHNKIDPLGFALENFDASGGWRTRERRGNQSEQNPNDPLIDARAQLPGGTEFVGVGGLQTELMKQGDKFLHCLAEKLYAYALGRELGYADEPTINNAVKHMKRNGMTLRSLIHHIVTSEAFRSK